MGDVFGAYLIDSPPFTLDIEGLTAAWNRTHPDRQISVPYPTNPFEDWNGKYEIYELDLTIDEEGTIVGGYDELFVLFLEFYREYLPAEYKLCYPLGVYGPSSNVMIEKGFRAEDWEEIQSEKYPDYQVEIQPGTYPRKRSVIYWQNPLYRVREYSFMIDYPSLEADLRQKLPTAALEREENDPDSCIIYYRTALARMDFPMQTLLIADSQPDNTWDLMQWYRNLVPLEHHLNITVRSWLMHTTKLPRMNGGVYSRIDLKEISEIPYQALDNLSKEALVAFLREVTHDWLQRPGYQLWD